MSANPADFPEPEMVDVGEVTLAVYRAGPKPGSTDKPTIVLLHGWPELAFSWRHQMPALAAAGYPVLAPDNRGFGASDKPEGAAMYTGRKLAADCRGLIQAYGQEKAIFVGHDWGALVLWMLPFFEPDILLGCIGLNVALMGRPPLDPIALFRAAYGEDMYIVQFQTEGQGEAILEKDLARTFRFFFRQPGKGSDGKMTDGAFENEKLDLLGLLQRDESSWGGVPLIGEAELARYVEGYSAGGMTYPLHWYRNFTQNYDDMGAYLDAEGKFPKVTVPCLQILAELDRACPPSLADGIEDRIDDVEVVTFDTCGHWTMQERPDALNHHMLDWLGRKF